VLPAWEEHLGLDELSEELDVPLLVDNDANLGALAEHWWGSGGDVDNLAYIKVATGIGSGHIIGGEIYRGATGVAGEIGHLAIDPHGKPCICGLRGSRTSGPNFPTAPWPTARRPSRTSRAPPWMATPWPCRSSARRPTTWAPPWPAC
jgi:hypothetical protein